MISGRTTARGSEEKMEISAAGFTHVWAWRLDKSLPNDLSTVSFDELPRHDARCDYYSPLLRAATRGCVTITR
jgi:hypothetical protein